MARQSLLRKYLLIFTSILVMTFLSVYLIQRTFEKNPDSPLVIGGEGREESLVTLAVQLEPDTLDPAKQESSVEHMVCSLLYQSLYEDAGGGVVASDLIEQTAEERGALLIDLNPLKIFHSGRRVGAEDVKYSIERTIRQSAKESARLVSMMAGLGGMEEFLEGKTADIEGIQIVDGNTVRIEWSEDMDMLKRILSLPEFSVLEKTTLLQVNNYGASFRNQTEPTINGSGPYRIVAWDDQFLAMEPVEKDDGENSSRLEIRFFDQLDAILYGFRLGECDAALTEVAIEEEEDYFPSESLGWNTLSSGDVLYMKTGVLVEPALDNVLILALDRSELKQTLGWERVLESSPELSAGQDQADVYYENHEIARSSWTLIQEEQVELQIGYRQSASMADAAQALKESYAELGIPVKLVSFETIGLMEEALQTGVIQAYIDTYYADAELYENGAYLHVRQTDLEADMKYVPLLQNELYYRFAESDNNSSVLSEMLER